MELLALDYVIFGVLLVSAALSLMRGFVKKFFPSRAGLYPAMPRSFWAVGSSRFLPLYQY